MSPSKFIKDLYKKAIDEISSLSVNEETFKKIDRKIDGTSFLAN